MKDRLAYVGRAPFEAAIALASLMAAMTYLIDPTSVRASAVGHAARILLPYWVALYGIGGAAILFGLFMRSVRIELTGLVAFSSALTINALSIVNFAGVQGVVSATTFAALGGACIARGRYLWRSWANEARSRSGG